MDSQWTWYGHAVCVFCVQHQRAARAANLSVALYACTIVSTVLIVEQNFVAVVAYALGGWAGTYAAVKWSNRHTGPTGGGEKQE